MEPRDKAAGTIVIGFVGATGALVAPSAAGKLVAASLAAIGAIGWTYWEPAQESSSTNAKVVPIGMAIERDIAAPVATVRAIARVGPPIIRTA
jgi:hypothetical protein